MAKPDTRQKKTPSGTQPAPKKKVMKEEKYRWYKPFLPLLVILPLVFIAFSPILNNELTNWDDPDLITENPLIRELSFANLKTIFTTFYFGNYQPLHLVSYSIEYQLWQLNPTGYHAMSLFLFLGITAMVYWFTFLISRRRQWVAILATLLFALNAMRVESVAWAAERKDMLYALFYMAALVAYVRYIMSHNSERNSYTLRFLVYAFLLFTLSVFSKVMAVSLVGAMVFLDYLYARRLSFRLVLEKIPFVVLSVIMGLVQIRATASTSTFDTSGQFDLLDRILIVCRNFMFFVYKMVAPFNLSAFHPYPTRLPGEGWPLEFYLAPLFALAVLVLFIWSIRHSRILVFTIGFFFSGLALVLQFVAIGPAMFNERYSLIPAVALSFALATLAVNIMEKHPSARGVVLTISGIYLALMMVLTFARCNVWQNSLSLWDDVLAQYPRAAMALNNRGRIHGSELGNTTQAMEDLTAAIASDPAYEQPYSNRGIIFAMKGEKEKALADFNSAIRLKPDYYEAIANRAILYAQMNRPDSALPDFNRCIGLAPANPALYLNRGLCNYQLRKYDDAIRDFNKALSLDPANGEIFLRRSQAYHEMGKHTEAYRDLMTSINAGVRVEQTYVDLVKSSAGL